MVMEEEKKERNITSDELKKHNQPSDLWISIQGKVYDVTDWLDSHPGGEIPLLSLAGQDVTDSFVAYHPPSAWRHLDRFLIGRLSDYRVSDVSKDYRLLVAEFSKLGLFDQKGHITAFTLLFTCLLFIVSVSGVLFSSSPLVHILSGGLMGFLWIQSWVLTGNCLAGISIGWWKRNHNAHHIAVNSLDFDPDLQHMPLFAISSKLFASITSRYYDRKMNFDAVSRFFISYQHWTFYPVMCVARVNLFGQSIVLLLSNKKVPNRGQEIAGVVAFWIWYPFLVSFLPSWTERVAFVLASFAVTGIQHVQFCLNHFPSSVYVGHPCGTDWFEKQTSGTHNIDCPPWMDWFHGGLQFQVEHHLFPRLPRCHLRRIAPLAKELCKKHNLVYSSSSFWEANKLTVGVLRAAALQARQVGSPVPKNLVWEAVNTHG
ncbi:Delta(8)-fatty-acid desaturase [Acorus calamus]|uniref:Delta(8)-fatty-acid desaturase n=1 Tax=Acorus calamus TaxID=4465 RepID=A0AAV9CAS9_ACOCL|nr:Delta(8)-fatty-acid desaturase [Acorus calamus]